MNARRETSVLGRGRMLGGVRMTQGPHRCRMEKAKQTGEGRAARVGPDSEGPRHQEGIRLILVAAGSHGRL